MALFGILFLLTTISVAYAITALVNINKIADPALAQTQQFITIGLALNAVAWFLQLIAVGVAARSPRWEAGLDSLAFLFVLAGSILLLIAATQLDRVVLRVIYIFTLTAGIFGIIAAFFQLVQGVSLIRSLVGLVKGGVMLTEDTAKGLGTALNTFGGGRWL